MDALLLIAGLGMLSHVVLSKVASRGITDPRLESELFAVPNRFLGTSGSIRLLRIRYCFPFSSLPVNVRALEPRVRATLLAARVAGLCFLCALVGFLVAVLVEAGN